MSQMTIETDAQILDALETKLGRLAARWRGTENWDDAAALVRQYQSILRCMVELGYRDSLDPDAELPDALMPEEYLRLFTA